MTNTINNELELTLYTKDGQEYYRWTRFTTIDQDVRELISFAEGNIHSIELYDPGTQGTIELVSAYDEAVI